jgi:hypothetical protein
MIAIAIRESEADGAAVLNPDVKRGLYVRFGQKSIKAAAEAGGRGGCPPTTCGRSGKIEGRERSEKKKKKKGLISVSHGRARAERARRRRAAFLVGSLEEEGAAAIRLSWASASGASKKKKRLLSVSHGLAHGLARRRRGC